MRGTVPVSNAHETKSCQILNKILISSHVSLVYEPD